MSAVKEGFVQEVIERYEGDPGMLIPMMQDLQAEYGYLPPDELERLARELGVPLTRVYGVAMFYSSFRLTPKGRHEVTLCMGTVCYLKGAPQVSEAICAEYGIQPGGTTADQLFTLQAVNCVGACALAPVMIVDGKYHDGVTPDSALKILGGLGAAGEEEPAAAEKAVQGAGEPAAAEPPPAAPAAQPPQPAPAPQAASLTPPEAAAKPPKPKTKAKARTKGKTTKAAAPPRAASSTSPRATPAAAPKAAPAAKDRAKPAAKPKPAKAKAKPKPAARKRSRP